jgi:hypothetical protein
MLYKSVRVWCIFINLSYWHSVKEEIFSWRGYITTNSKTSDCLQTEISTRGLQNAKMIS